MERDGELWCKVLRCEHYGMVWYGMGRDVMAWDGNVPGAMRFYSMLRCRI